MEQIDLADTSRNYIALSCTWGPPIIEPVPRTCNKSHSCEPCTLCVVPQYNVPTADPDTIDLEPQQFASLRDCTCMTLEQNLSDFFIHHHQDLITKKLPIWIDAICINQADKQEVSNQILLMGEIYATADMVLAWLGEDGEDLDSILWFVNIVLPGIFRLMHRKASSGLPQEEFEDTLASQHPLDGAFWANAMGVTPPEGKTWLECFASFYRFFFRRRWFTRAWVVQEAVLAKSVRFVCHKSHFDFDELFDLDYHFSITSWNKRLFIDSGFRSLVSGLRCGKERGELYTIFHLRTRLEQKQRRESNSNAQPLEWPFEFARLLHLVHHQDATVPRDYVYCVLGMAKCFAPVVKAEPFPVHEDECASGIFTRSCEIIIQNSGQLGILSYVADRAEVETAGLPSWVTDWASKANASRIGSPNIFNATEDFSIEASTRPVVKAGILLVSGAKVDVVDQVFPNAFGRVTYFNESDGLDLQRAIDLSFEAANIFMQLFVKLGPIYMDRESIEDAIRRTLILDHTDREANEYPAPPAHLREGFHYFLRLIFTLAAVQWDVHEAETTKSRQSQILEPLAFGMDSTMVSILAEIFAAKKHEIPLALTISSILANPGAETALYGFLADAGRKAISRSFFITKSAHLCYGFVSTKPDDEVWLLGTHNIPVVLRPQPETGHYVFMGNAYIHGIMHGEYMTPDVVDCFHQIEIV